MYFVLGENNVASLIVLANDSPYGVIYWEQTSYITTEPEGFDQPIMLYILREQGTLGDIRVSYRSAMA